MTACLMINFFLIKGRELFKEKRYEEAIKYFDRAVNLDSYNTEAWNEKGVALYKLKRYEEALKCCNKALEINPENAYSKRRKKEILEVLDIPFTPPETPLLDRYGRDLTGLAGKSKSPVDLDIKEDSLSSVLVEKILSKKREKILLIRDSKRRAEEVIEKIAFYLQAENGTENAKNKRIIQIRPSILKEEVNLEKLFKDVARDRRIILYIDGFLSFLIKYKNLKENISDPFIFCIGGIDRKDYEEYILPDSNWKNFFKPLWIHEKQELPQKL